jgi:hypothetical protein
MPFAGDRGPDKLAIELQHHKVIGRRESHSNQCRRLRPVIGARPRECRGQ